MTDERLMRAIAGKDEAAMDRLMNQYAKLLWSVAAGVLRPLGTDEDLEECVADVFAFLWLNPEKYDPARGSLKSYLALVTRSRARNLCRQLLRRQTLPLEALEDAAGPADPEQDLSRRQRAQDLREALDTLGEPDREILLRRYCWDQKPREIAAALDLPVKQIDNRLYRTKQALRAHVQREELP